MISYISLKYTILTFKKFVLIIRDFNNLVIRNYILISGDLNYFTDKFSENILFIINYLTALANKKTEHN